MYELDKQQRTMYPVLGCNGVFLKTIVQLTKKAHKDLLVLPKFILDKVEIWLATIDEIGILNTRKIKGFHDEPLKGNRQGQRSIRLNRSYRLIYVEVDKKINVIQIIEINKHEY